MAAARSVWSIRSPPTGIDWETQVPAAGNDSAKAPPAGAGFAELPGFAMNAANYKQVEKDFAEWLYRNERAEVFSCPALKAWSKLGESEGDFRARLTHEAREARDAAIEKLRAATAKKIDTLEGRMRTAEGQLAKEKAESNAAKMQAGVSVLGGLLGGLFGRKTSMPVISRGSTAIGQATSAYKQHQDVANAGERLEDLAEGNRNPSGGTRSRNLAHRRRLRSRQPEAGNRNAQADQDSNVKVEQVALLWLG